LVESGWQMCLRFNEALRHFLAAVIYSCPPKVAFRSCFDESWPVP
jgi:hypothetical protein